MKIAQYEIFLDECLQAVIGIAPLRSMITEFALPAFSITPDLMHDLILFRPFTIDDKKWPISFNDWKFQSVVAESGLDGNRVRGLGSFENGMANWEMFRKTSQAQRLDLQDAFAPYYARPIFEESGAKITSRYGGWTKTCRKTGQLTVGEFLDLVNLHDLKPEILCFTIDGIDRAGRVCVKVLYK